MFRHNGPTIDLVSNGLAPSSFDGYSYRHTVERKDVVWTSCRVIIPELSGQEVTTWCIETTQVFHNGCVVTRQLGTALSGRTVRDFGWT